MVKDVRENRRRVSIDIRTDIYKRMKISAVKHNSTMTQWVQRAIYGRLKWEEEHE